MINKRQSWKWKIICGNFKNPISEFDVGQMSFENRRTCKAHFVSTTRGGKVWNMDWWSSKKAQLQTTISIKKYATKYSPKWMGAIYFSTTIYGSKS